MRRLLFLLALILLVLACSGGDTTSDGVASSEAGSPTAATVEPATSEPWDLVFFSDSSGRGVANAWAEQIQEEVGVAVRVHDYAQGGLPAATILDRLNDEDPALRELIAEAEIFVVNGNPRASGSETDVERCVTGIASPPRHYDEEDFAGYEAVLVDIYEVILDQRACQPTMVRALDLYNGRVADWELAGIETECSAAWEAFTAATHRAAAQFDIPTAAVAVAFMGPGFDEDARAKGLIGTDGLHATAEGGAVILPAKAPDCTHD